MGVIHPAIMLPQPLGTPVERLGIARIPEVPCDAGTIPRRRRIERTQCRIGHHQRQVEPVHRQRCAVGDDEPEIPRLDTADPSSRQRCARQFQQRRPIGPVPGDERPEQCDRRIDIAGFAFHAAANQHDGTIVARGRRTDLAERGKCGGKMRLDTSTQGVLAQFDDAGDKGRVDLSAACHVASRRTEKVASECAKQGAERHRIGVRFLDFGSAECIPTERPLGLQLRCPFEFTLGIAKMRSRAGELADSQAHVAKAEMEQRVVPVMARAVDAARLQGEQHRRIRCPDQRVPQPEDGLAVRRHLSACNRRNDDDQHRQPRMPARRTGTCTAHCITVKSWWRASFLPAGVATVTSSTYIAGLSFSSEISR